MEICYLINQLAPGGAPTLLLDIVRNSSDGESYTICQMEGDTSLANEFSQSGAEVVNFGARFKFDPIAMSKMASYFRKNEFDILHAHLPYSQTLARTIGRVGKVDKIISTQHSFPSNYHPITRFLERQTRWLDDATIGISKAITQSFRESPTRTDWYTIYNGTNVERLSKKTEHSDSNKLKSKLDIEEETIFLNVGRYVPVKSQSDLIRAVSMRESHFQDSHFLIVGWGPLEAELTQLADDLGVSDRVTITGQVPKEDIHRYYALADAFILPSKSEGFGICLIEAMAASLPVIATDIPGVREVVNDEKTGLLVPSSSPNKLANAIIELESVEKRHSLGKSGFKRVSNRFDIKNTIDQHTTLYHQLSPEDLQ
ncbi:glycosyltransferase [Natrialba asiatica]|uniref:Glycosyltransferase n=1 Tax=Natrialba asiatica (strain ATCC 700177 / DSM 12278 / JCM 9576 / FERM P-10747 / NBRC 102637 / 172P1) TaxID=29540 RepID=M0ATE2_NATA1|nr:glycosyltransferase [Natrialba asiatica]ELZ01820.1 glycosyltransferase [Natrialba asiatica DSM 12278]